MRTISAIYTRCFTKALTLITFVLIHSAIQAQESATPSKTLTSIDLKMEVNAAVDKKPEPKSKNRLTKKTKESLEAEITEQVKKYTAIKNCGPEIVSKCESFISAKLDSAWTEEDYTTYLTTKERVAAIQKYMESFPIPDDCRIKKSWGANEKKQMENTLNEFFGISGTEANKLIGLITTNCPDYSTYVDFLKEYKKNEDLEKYKNRLKEYLDNCAQTDASKSKLTPKKSDSELLKGKWKSPDNKYGLEFNGDELTITKPESKDKPRKVKKEWLTGGVIEIEDALYYTIDEVTEGVLKLKSPDGKTYEFKRP